MDNTTIAMIENIMSSFNRRDFRDVDKESTSLVFRHFPIVDGFEIYSNELMEYVVNEVFKKSRYIFTTRKAKKQYSYCTHCRSTYETVGLMHNEKIWCPECNSDCTVKSSGRGRKSLIDRAYFTYYEKSQMDPNVIIARGIYATRDYSGNYETVNTKLDTKAYYVFDLKNGCKMLKRGWNSEKGRYVWWESKTIHWYYRQLNENIPDYYSKKSIREAVKDTPFSWSGWEKYDHEDMTKFFELYVKYPMIEYITKLGFTELINSKLYGRATHSTINWRGKNLFKVLRLTKQELNEIKSEKIKVTCWFLKLLKMSKKLQWDISLKEIGELQNSILVSWNLERLIPVTQYTSVKKAINYIEKQFKEYRIHYADKESVLRDWKDYIDDCIKLEFDLTSENVVMPRYLHQAHQNTITQIEVKANEALQKDFDKRFKEVQKYCFEYEGLFIKPVETPKELILEGKALHHCVGTYAERYAKGETTILFIRKLSNPEEPYYTMELHKGRIYQVRGYNNCLPKEEMEKFVEAFKKNVLEKLEKKSHAKDKNKLNVAIPA